jgi:hypothetical protein
MAVWVMGAGLVLGRAEPALDEAYRDATRLLFNAGYERVRALGELDGAGARERALAEAVLLPNVQPKTAANIAAAETRLRELAAGTDDIAITAEVMLGRLAQVQRLTPDLAAARGHYDRAWARAPDHPLVEWVMARAAVLDLYTVGPAWTPLAVAEWARRAEGMKDAVARRDLHLVLGDFYRRVAREAEQARAHYAAAEATGKLSETMRGDVWLWRGQLAAELGETVEARAFFGKFAAAFPRDARTYLAGRLAAGGEVLP